MKAAIALLDVLLKVMVIGVILALMFACEPEYAEPYETFVIPKGKHSKGFPLQSLQSTELEFSAIFDESAMYISRKEVNQWDVNKLMGFSDCNSHHHQNSARFGWAWQDEKLEIFAYVYAEGERIIEPLGGVDLNKPSHYQLSIYKDFYSFRLDGYEEVRIERKNKCDLGLYYMLFPYFGGDEVAPHDIAIKVKTQY